MVSPSVYWSVLVSTGLLWSLLVYWFELVSPPLVVTAACRLSTPPAGAGSVGPSWICYYCGSVPPQRGTEPLWSRRALWALRRTGTHASQAEAAERLSPMMIWGGGLLYVYRKGVSQERVSGSDSISVSQFSVFYCFLNSS